MDASAWDDRYRTSELVWTGEPNIFLVEVAAKLGPGRALDVACGEGRNAVWLASQGWRVSAADFSARGLEKAQALATGRGVELELIEADVVRWQPQPRSFDLVAVLYLQLEAAERDLALAAAASAVAPGGSLLVVAHDSTNLEEGYGGPGSASVLYSAADVVAALPELAIRAAGRRERVVSTDDGERIALDAVAWLARP